MFLRQPEIHQEANRPAVIVWLTSETTPQGSISYTCDVAGRRTSMTVAGQPEADYSHDNDNRLTQIAQGTTTIVYSYDPFGKLWTCSL